MHRRCFSDQPSAVREARRFVTDVLASQSPKLVETACLLVSELATNAVRHARTEFQVVVEPSPTRVRVEVWDAGRGGPMIQTPSPSEPHGRGLQIVARLADTWGVVKGSCEKGVWFAIGTKASGPGAREPAPRQ